MDNETAHGAGAAIPFDHHRLDRLMDEAGLDVLLATSKHNVRYLLGGYSFIFFSAMEALGHSRYLPVLVYAKGRPDHAAYVAYPSERGEHENRPFWTPTFLPTASTSAGAAALAVEHLQKLGIDSDRIGVEPSFLPADAYAVLARALGRSAFADATFVLERLRALKTPAELDRLRAASEGITDAMLAVFSGHGAGATKGELVEALRREEVARGLGFDYCLIAMGTSHNRAVSGQAWREGEVLSLDSGGNFDGYIGDLCRMAVLGAPDAELEDLLAEVDAVQQAAFAASRAGVTGGAVAAAAGEVLQRSPNAASLKFVVHGMGLVSHEVPFLAPDHPAYEGVDAERPLEAGMVLSVETTMRHPRRGFVKLEDTVAVTAGGCELIGERGRGWNRGGTAL